MTDTSAQDNHSLGFGRYSKAEALYFRRELQQAGLTQIAGARVVEIGFGRGAFAQWSRDQGCLYAGIELDAALIDSARRSGFAAHPVDVPWDAAFGRNRIDLIVALDVLEHMELREIRAVLQNASACLRIGGLFLGRMPSGDSPFSGAIWTGDPTHCTLLGSSSIRSLASEAGLLVSRIGPPALPIIGLGARYAFRRMAVRVAQRMTHGLISRVLIGRRDAVVTPNMVFVLRKSLAEQLGSGVS